MAANRKSSARAKKTRPSIEDASICPFTGEAVEIIEVKAGEYQTPAYFARGPFWHTRIFESKQDLLWHLAHRGGVEPNFSRKAKIEVKEPESVVAEVTQPEISQQEQAQEQQKEAVRRQVQKELDRFFGVADNPKLEEAAQEKLSEEEAKAQAAGRLPTNKKVAEFISR